jgi:hypothetical protein
MTAPKSRQEVAEVGLLAQGQRGKLEPHCPSFGLRLQYGKVFRRK